MKAPDLIQTKGFHKVEFTLETDGIAIFEKKWSISQRIHVYYENIPPKATEINFGERRVGGGAIFFSCLAIITLVLAFFKVADWSAPLVWGTVAAIFWVGYMISRKSFIRFMQNGNGLNLHRNKPSVEAVSAFIQKMFQLRNIYLLKKYGVFLDEESVENKLTRLNYLRSQEVISESEFEAQRLEFVNGRTKPAPGPLGFAAQ